jgi:hypothetical protein
MRGILDKVCFENLDLVLQINSRIILKVEKNL